jgi:arginine utilization protein RocB
MKLHRLPHGFEEVIKDINIQYERFIGLTNGTAKSLSWESQVINFEELYLEAFSSYGDDFIKKYENKINELINKLENNRISVIDSNFELIEFIYGYIDDKSPKVVYGLIPPYYPNVSNIYFKTLDPIIKNLSSELNKFTEREFNQTYTSENFYTGISDLSYTNADNSSEILKALESSMPLLGEFYNIPIDIIEKISMPCINIGPWGKDFHKLTERVNIEDLYIRTPGIINYTIKSLLNN